MDNERNSFENSPLMTMSPKTQAFIAGSFIGVPALIMADMALGLESWLVAPELVGIAGLIGLGSYVMKRSNIDPKELLKGFNWGSLLPSCEQDDDIPDEMIVDADPMVPQQSSQQTMALPASSLVDLGDKLQLDIDDLVGKAIFICGIRRSGKTTLGAKLAEELGRFYIPMLIPDIKRDYISLKGHLPRPLVLGQAQLTVENAKRMGKGIFEEGYQIILDMASYDTVDTACDVLCEMIDGLFEWARQHPESKRPCEVFLDEAQTFLPQEGGSIISDSRIYKRMLSTYKQVLAVGGSLGLNPVILTQRIAQVNKVIVGQPELLFLLKQTMDTDLERYKNFTEIDSKIIRGFGKGQGIFVDYEGESHIIQFHNRQSDGSMSASPRAAAVLQPLTKSRASEQTRVLSEDEYSDDLGVYRESFPTSISRPTSRPSQAQNVTKTGGNGLGNATGNDTETPRETDNASHVAFIRDIARRLGNGENPVEIRKSLGVNSGRAVQDVNAVLRFLQTQTDEEE
jgi:hypothetical protein